MVTFSDYHLVEFDPKGNEYHGPINSSLVIAYSEPGQPLRIVSTKASEVRRDSGNDFILPAKLAEQLYPGSKEIYGTIYPDAAPDSDGKLSIVTPGDVVKDFISLESATKTLAKIIEGEKERAIEQIETDLRKQRQKGLLGSIAYMLFASDARRAADAAEIRQAAEAEYIKRFPPTSS